MSPFVLAIKSLRNRRVSVTLTVVSIGLSVALLFGVERIRREAQTSFTNTISGTDLIVGARTGSVQLLLSSVFRIGNASNNIGMDSYKAIVSNPAVEWSIPISLGDSHRGYRVMGTTEEYFEHLKYGRQQRLKMKEGEWFHDADGAVLGSETAKRLGYSIGDEVVVAHGSGDVSFIKHDAHPFKVTGILAPTGTPIDRTVHVSLHGMDAIHEDMDGEPHEERLDPLKAALLKAKNRDHENDDDHDHEHSANGHGHDDHDEIHSHTPRQITAFFVGLKSRSAALGMQRMINEFKAEPLSAVLPAVALQELWEIVGVLEKAFLAVSGFVVLVGLAGMLVAIMNSLNERRREMAVLRSVGAKPTHIFGLIVGEAGIITVAGVLFGWTVIYALLLITRPIIAANTGLFVSIGSPSAYEFILAVIIVFAGLLIGVIPAYRCYCNSLADGLTVRV
jgi:putative ABC transport system permease protein